MAQLKRVVTANLPEEMASKLDEIALRIDRSKSWMVVQALTEWLADAERRHELTLEALRSVDDGRTIAHEDVVKRVEDRIRSRRQRQSDKSID